MDRGGRWVGRPRKNRVGEYAGLLGEAVSGQISQEMGQALAKLERTFQVEMAKIHAEVRLVNRRMEALERRNAARPRVGKWVPGGPGRPPKDADSRIQAFRTRSQTREEDEAFNVDGAAVKSG
jgi:hypothetical protein